MAPSICTSKCLMLSVRLPASRTSAYASGSSEVRVSPLLARYRSERLSFRSSVSFSFCVLASRTLTWSRTYAHRASRPASVSGMNDL